MVLLKNAIVRNVSHELRTPLLQVKSAVALLAEDVQNNSLADYATNATARLEAIVTNITQLAGSQDIDPNPVIVRECVGYACRNLRRAWEHKGAAERIVTKIADDLPPAFADRQSLSTVMQLLIDNALKFSDDPVEVEAQQVGSRIRITVRDYGIGIAPDKLEAIFDSFYQVDNSSTRRYGGTGVGLAIVRLILDRHGVKIRVNSRPGHGSAFSFELPVAPTVS
jgi:signal transduction histidine kinase